MMLGKLRKGKYMTGFTGRPYNTVRTNVPAGTFVRTFIQLRHFGLDARILRLNCWRCGRSRAVLLSRARLCGSAQSLPGLPASPAPRAWSAVRKPAAIPEKQRRLDSHKYASPPALEGNAAAATCKQ